MVVKRAKDKSHYIVDIDGVPINYPSVSRILGAAFPSPFNPRNPGNKKDRKKCLQRGTEVHEAIQNNRFSPLTGIKGNERAGARKACEIRISDPVPTKFNKNAS